VKVRVKICGITTIDDARCAADLGADMLGFIFVPSSPRYIKPANAAQIIQHLGSPIVPVGVFANSGVHEILQTIHQTGIQCVQLHGNESPEECTGLPVEAIKAFRVKETFDTGVLTKYCVSAYLLDTYRDDVFGGTGQIFNWDIAVQAKLFGRVVLAGGLRPDNVGYAMNYVRPYAVDINSGVEASPGKKDRNKLQQLFHTIHQVQNE
jgi:phosphoribosylanthranilate isomerase